MPDRFHDPNRPLFGARPPEDLVGRAGEISLIGEVAEMLLKGLPSVILVGGLPGVGVSELLRQGAARFTDASRSLVAVYLSLETNEAASGLSLARELVCRARAGLAESDVRDGRDFAAWISGERGGVGQLLRRMAGTPGTGAPPDHLLPELAEILAREQDCRIMIFLDRHPRRAAGDPVPLPLRGGAAGGRVSWVVAVPPASDPGRNFPGGPARFLKLEPLEDALAGELLALAMSRHGVSLSRECRSGATLLGGIPRLIWDAATAARLLGLSSFEDTESFVRFYASETGQGFLQAYHLACLPGEGEIPDSRVLLDVMLHLTGRRGLPPDARTLAREMLMEEVELSAALAALTARGLLENRWGRIICAAPGPMVDFWRDQSRRHLEGHGPEECRARLAGEAMACLELAATRRSSRRNADELKVFIGTWQGQVLPKSLFDHERFLELSKGGPFENGGQLLEKDRSRLPLPRVLAVWEERFPGTEQFPAHEVDLLAFADPGKERQQRWLAVEVKLAEAEVTRKMVEDFSRRCRLLRNRADLAGGALTGWIVSGGTFSAEAREIIRKERLWSSSPAQLKLMAELAGYTGTMRLALPAKPAPGDEPWCLSLVIPARSEIELVAAKAMEQLSEGLPLGEAAVAKVKMALVEACLNAFEHSDSEDKNVHLTFGVRPDCLEIEVFNRGRSFVPERIVRPSIEEKVGAAHKRGWGLSIIKELMDEMEFLERGDGTCLRMRKYFTDQGGEGKHAEADRR